MEVVVGLFSSAFIYQRFGGGVVFDVDIDGIDVP